MGVAFCLLFAWWFASGIFMMYWDYPEVTPAARLDRAEPLDASKIRLSAEQAWAGLNAKGGPGGVTLAMFDSRPVYRFASGETVYADTGATQTEFPDDVLLRMAAAWAAQPAPSARREEITQADQWTIGLRKRLPLVKYSFPDGQQVYVSPDAGEVVQYTTTGSRVGAYLGPVAHWLYFTPLRVRAELWTYLIIYLSGIGTIMAVLGLVAGLWMLSPAKKYRSDGVPTSIPYSGTKRLHMILGLFFGIVTCTWAFSGMLSMDPPFLNTDPVGGAESPGFSAVGRIQEALHPSPFDFAAYRAKSPQRALAQLAGLRTTELEFTSFDGRPLYIARLNGRETRIVPVDGEAALQFDENRIFEMVAHAAAPMKIAEQRLMTQYDAYYLDRRRARPLPVLFVKLADPSHTQLYIDPRLGRTVEQHSDEDSFIERWLYHGLHSLNFPLLYNYRPAWDIAVLTLMLGGFSLCITSVTIAWRLVLRKLRRA